MGIAHRCIRSYERHACKHSSRGWRGVAWRRYLERRLEICLYWVFVLAFALPCIRINYTNFFSFRASCQL
jgi:hypothetical protein